jgi:hypothetical protein
MSFEPLTSEGSGCGRIEPTNGLRIFSDGAASLAGHPA